MADDIAFDETQTTKLKRWRVPDFAVVDDDTAARTIAIADLPPDVLDLMIQGFVADAYAAVGRTGAAQVSIAPAIGAAPTPGLTEMA